VPPAINKVAYYMVGPEGDTTGNNNKWLFSSGWPPASLPLIMYLDKASALTDAGAPGLLSSETFAADPAAPVGTVGGGLLPFGLEPAGPLAANPLFMEDASKFLWFTTGTQAADVTVAGDITLTLRVSLDSTNTTPSDCDVAAWLIDEDGGGNQLIVANGIVRLSDYLAKHGGGSVALDTPYNVTFSLGNRAYNFAAGHKLLLYIAGSNAPQYAPNPGNGDALYDGTNGIVQDIDLTYGDVAGQCQLLLPIRLP
jgi:putative CocE/NonD family hydrolase